MSAPLPSRRSFLKGAAGAIGAAVVAAELSPLACAAATASPGPLVRLGGPIFGASGDPEQLALTHRKLGYRAAYCPGVKLGDETRIRDIAAAFSKHDVVLAEVGRWCNLTDADPVRRAGNLKNVTEGLALAEAIGARCCVDIAGSLNTKSWFGPDPGDLSKDFFDAIVENARKIIDAVKPRRAKFCYEMMGWALPDCADAYLDVIKAVDRPGFGVHVDVCNVINCPSRFYRTTQVIDEVFDKLGRWIVSCHAKDIAWSSPIEMQVHLVEVLPGKGVLDYATYLKRVAALPGEVPLMLEHLKTAEEYETAKKHIMEVGGKAGVRF